MPAPLADVELEPPLVLEDELHLGLLPRAARRHEDPERPLEVLGGLELRDPWIPEALLEGGSSEEPVPGAFPSSICRMDRGRAAARAAFLAGSMLVATGAGALAGGPAGNAPEKVVLQLSYTPQFQFAGYYAALERGYYRAEGLDVEIRPSQGPNLPPLDRVLAGEADFGTCESDIAVARARGKPFVLLASIFQHSACCVVATAASGIHTPSDLVGRTVALSRTQRDAEVLAMLLHEGIPAEKLRVVDSDWEVESLVTGKLDARLSYVTNEPDQLRRRGVEPCVIQPLSYGIDFYGDSLFTTEAQVREHPERVAAFRRASIRGWEEAFEHTDAVIDLLYEKEGCRARGLSREHLEAEAAEIRRLVDPKVIEIGHTNRGRWQRIADTYAEVGLIPPGASIDGLFYERDAASSLPAWLRGLAIALAISLGAVGAALLWGWRLRALVNRRTRELRESEERFRSAFEDAHVGCALTRLDGVFLRVNRALCQLLGYTDSELVGHHFNEFTVPEDHAIGAAFVRSFSESPASNALFEKRYRHRDGRILHAQLALSVVRGENGAPLYIIGQVHDLTRRRAAEEALRESETRFRTMADCAPVMIWLAGTDGALEYVSQTWLSFTGRRLEDEAGQGWSRGVHPQDRERCLAERGAALEARRPFESFYRLRRADGEWRSILERGAPRFLADGTFAGFVGSCVDVSDRQLLEEQLRQSQKMEAIGRLAGGVAHDFNNVLAIVQGYTELLLRDLASDEKRRQHLEHISAALEHATGFTRQLLTLGRRQVLSPTVVELSSVVRDMQLVLRRVIGEDIELVTALGPGASSVEVDRAQLEQVLLNLVVNARDAMPTGGKLTIESLSKVVAPDAPRPPLEPGRWVTLVVRDTGSGMDERTLSRIFEPFFTTKERGKGTGLGLSIVYGIVTQSGGRVEAASEPGKGSVFTVFLREASGPPGPVPVPAPSDVPHGTETILLVEDDPGVRRSTEGLLGALGYRVVLAEDGAAALARLDESGAVDLVLTDVLMPRMTGPELARHISRRSAAPRVLFMSGHVDDEGMRGGGLPPGALLLEKPFKLAQLARKVREALR